MRLSHILAGLLALWFGFVQPSLGGSFSECQPLFGITHRWVRTGTLSCWVQQPIGEKEICCVSQAVWLGWMKQNAPGPPWTVFWKEVERFRERLSGVLAEQDRFGILRSLLVNEGASLENLLLMRRLGFVHLVSASGIHLMAWMNGFLYLLKLWEVGFPLGRIRLRFGPWLQVAGVLGPWICLWILGGRTISLWRPGLVIGLRWIARVFGFHWRDFSPLCISLLLTLSFESQFSLRASYLGAWHYALAVGGGLVWYRCCSHPHWGFAVGSWILPGLAELWEHHTVALATPLLSLLTLPVICIGIYPLALLGLGFYCFILYGLGEEYLGWALRGWDGLEWVLNLWIEKILSISLWPGNVWMVSRGSLLLGLLISGFCLQLRTGFWVVSGKKEWPKGLSLLTVLGLGVRWVSYLPSKMFDQTHAWVAAHIEQIDVGQGDSAWLEGARFTDPKERRFLDRFFSRYKSRHSGMIDTGSYYSRNRLGWMDWFADHLVQNLDWVGLTHLDSDHAGGISHLMDLVELGCIALPGPLQQTARGQVVIQYLLERGIKVTGWNQQCIPYPTLVLKAQRKRNKKEIPNGIMGIVLVPLTRGGYYLSMGDARGADEIRVLNWLKQLQKTTLNKPLSKDRFKILKVGHHGSHTSSTLEFIRQFHPTQAWISVGKNGYGHPTLKVLKRFSDLGVRVKRTDLLGSLAYPRGVKTRLGWKRNVLD